MRVLGIFAGLFFSVAVFANQPPQVAARLDHGQFRNVITVAQSFDGERVCIFVTATRHPSGASTNLECYKGLSPNLRVQHMGHFVHGGNNINTAFRIEDINNGRTCFGSLITRHSVTGQANTEASGASIDLSCTL